MRSYHRKTLIRKEYWPQIDDWYWCPLPLVGKRIINEFELNKIKKEKRYNARWRFFHSWETQQWKLEARLAHACDDGRIRAPSWVEYYKQKNGSVSIYGKCRHCEKSLSDGIKGIIIMEKEL